MWYIVYFSHIIALLEDDMSIVEHIGYETVTFNIHFQYTLHIHEFDIIHEQETRMDEYDGIFSDEHNSTKIINRIEYELEKDIVDCYE